MAICSECHNTIPEGLVRYCHYCRAPHCCVSQHPKAFDKLGKRISAFYCMFRHHMRVHKQYTDAEYEALQAAVKRKKVINPNDRTG